MCVIFWHVHAHSLDGERKQSQSFYRMNPTYWCSVLCRLTVLVIPMCAAIAPFYLTADKQYTSEPFRLNPRLSMAVHSYTPAFCYFWPLCCFLTALHNTAQYISLDRGFIAIKVINQSCSGKTLWL